MRPIAKGVLAVATALLLALGAVGCQPNPTTPPVVQKGDLENKIKDKTPAPNVPATSADAGATTTGSQTQAPTAPVQLQKSYADGKLAVNINADVTQPTGALPVLKVSTRKFTQAEADKILQVLFQGKQAYKPREQMSKSEIEKAILDMKAMKSQAKGENKDKMNQKFDAAIASLQEQLKTAPDSVQPVPSDGKFKTDELGGMELNVNASLGKDSAATLDIFNSASGRTCSVWFTNEDSGSSYLGNESKLNGNPRGVKMTPDEAKALAEKTVADIGSDLKLVNICLGTQRGSVQVPADEAKQCYLLAFSREVNGVPSTYESDIGGNVPQEDIDRADAGGDYIEPHPYERIMMAIDDSGILEFQWLSPDKLLDTVSSDAQTMSLEQAMDTFQKQFFIHNALPRKSDVKPIIGKDGTEIPQDYSKSARDAGIFTMDSIGFAEDIKSCTFNVDRITLGLSRIAAKDKPDEFLIVPVWDFFGTATVEYTPESGYTGFTTTDANKSFLTINAIDGSIINRGYGY